MKSNNKPYDISFNRNGNIQPLNTGDIPAFDTVLKAQTIYSRKLKFKMVIRYSLSAVAVLAVAAAAIYMNNSNAPQPGKTMANIPDDFKDTVVVKAPVEQWDIAYTSFKIDAETDNTIEMPSGTRLTFEANSLIDSNGNTVKGEVEIKSREFFDPIDIMVAGIPMQYDSAGISYTLETAGMIEVKGYQGSAVLAVAPGKSIQIAQMSRGDNSYNTYALDEKKGKWEYKGRPELKEIKLEAVDPPMENSAPIVEKFYDTEEAHFRYYDYPEQVTPERRNETMPSFRLDVNPDQFPELALYNNVLFELLPGEKINSDNTDWDMIELISEKKGMYRVILHDRGKKFSARVKPVFNDGKDYKKAIEDFKKQYDERMAAINKQRALDEIKLKEMEKKNQITPIKYDKLNYGEVVRTFQADRFGYWNSDRPYRFSNPETRQIQFTIDNKELPLANVYQIETSANALMVNYRMNGNNGYYFTFSKGQDNILFTVLPGTKKIAILREEDFKKTIVTGQQVVDLKTIDKTFSSADDVRNYIIRQKQ